MENLRKTNEEELEILRTELDETKLISDKVSKEKEDLSKDFDIFRQSSSNFKVDFSSSLDNPSFILWSQQNSHLICNIIEVVEFEPKDKIENSSW